MQNGSAWLKVAVGWNVPALLADVDRWTPDLPRRRHRSLCIPNIVGGFQGFFGFAQRGDAPEAIGQRGDGDVGRYR